MVHLPGETVYYPRMTKSDRKPKEDAERILKRVEQESEVLGASSMRRTADHIKNHIGAKDADQDDWSEVWGARLGRVLSIIFFIFLVVYLARTYVFQ